MILYGIATKPEKRGPMNPVDRGQITSVGLEGNYYGALHNFAQNNRQITVISLDQWREAMRELNANIPWYMRRANLCVTDYSFGPDDVGKILFIGSNIRLEITRETDPCKRMDEILPGLHAALTPSWRGGVCCRVIEGGMIHTGDRVRFYL